MPRITWTALFFGMIAALPCQGKEKWTVDDVINADSATGFQVSPDGRRVVWVKSVPNKEKNEHVSNLMLTDLEDGETIELTRGNEDCTDPKWSLDGKHIAFLTARAAPKGGDDKRPKRRREAKKDDEPKTQIWLINPRGGEPWRLTDFSRDIAHYDWAGNDRLVFAAQEEKSHYESLTDDEKKDTSRVVEDEKHEPPVRLFEVEVSTKKITRLTTNTDRIDLLAVSPDGKRAVARHNRSLSYEYDARIRPVFRLHDLAAGDSKPIFDDRKFSISAIRWLPDSSGFLAVNEFSSRSQSAYPGILHLHHFDLKTGGGKQVDLQWDRGLGTQVANADEPGVVPTDGGFHALLADGVHNKLARFTRDGDGWKREWVAGESTDHVFGLAARTSKNVVFARSTSAQPGEWYHAPIENGKLGDAKAITSLNEKVKDLPIAKTEVVRWKGANDEEVEGLLYYPHDYEEGKRYPLVVMIHGGPAYADPDMWDESWAYAPNLYCQRNAFVFRPNYHGSSNYGLKWVESITGGKYYDLEVPDIEKGVDYLIGRGLVDKDKLGLLGWSNGAILTIELTTRSNRYKAAATGAGDVDWVSDWGNCDFGESFDRAYLGKSLFEDPQLYIRKSPFYRLDKVRTPTLIFFGSEDRTVATQQGWMHYRALQQLKKTDVKFILFPDEKHSPTKLAHQRRKLEEELAWFDKYLFENTSEDNEVVKKESPLWSRLKLAYAARVQDMFGIPYRGKIIPETVRHERLELGRFEVTRAQFNSFKRTFSPLAPGADYPATGVTFEDATRYCEWLSELTGDTYRLPAEEEVKDLYQDTDGENTLDHWAGYTVNPDDAKKLRAKLDQLAGEEPATKDDNFAPLLKSVGQFKAVGKSGVYDLGGNAAEWVTDKDGKGKLLGGSADQPADSKARVNGAGPAYQGFRVVREAKEQK